MSNKAIHTETLPDPLPDNPLQLAAEWLAQARIDAAQPNPNAMVLATVDGRGQPSARVVLCKEMAAEAGFIVFYTNYQSRKGRELEGNPQAAIVFHWDHRHRQVRAEGRVERLSDAENDAYFGSRPWQSRLGAWASRQSEPVESRHALARAVATAAKRFGVPYAGPGSEEPESVTAEIARPPNWGGFRLNVDAMELWVEGEFRVHDRARWTRRTADTQWQNTAAATQWSVTRLQP
ncbi:MAG TPA: pyridoxamine 5'-phosphate oxidase [Steroidobacteraceae bacterium]|nr:pyridoxamine 5'-phosphate oxidase [Steroidobacteraceae bacterium]